MGLSMPCSIIVIAALVVAMIDTVGGQQNPGAGSDDLSSAATAIKSGDYRSAMITLQPIVLRSPNNWQARSLLVLAYIGDHDVDRAEAEIVKLRGSHAPSETITALETQVQLLYKERREREFIAAVSPDKKRRAVGRGKSVQVVEVASNTQVWEKSDTLIWETSAEYLAKTGQVVRPPSEITALVYSPDAKYLFTGDRDGRICSRDATNGGLRWVYYLPTKLTVSALNISADGQSLSVITDGNTALVLAPWDGRLLRAP
jgi:WD40 repeat protein